ncbi:alpha/beta hydrolase family protein [Campylobacter concisus]
MSQISTKEQILKFKDYADIADASYAMLHWVNENEKNGLDDLYNKFGKDNAPENIVNSYKKQEIEKPIWRYADDITKGDKIDESNETDTSQSNNRKFGEPTAYALSIEARFNQDIVITKPKVNEQSEPKIKSIDNEVQSFIATPDDKPPYIFVNKENYHQISLRTKAFVNRYELVHHIKNTSITGFSSTVFYDSKFNNYIIGFRGTELGFKDLVFTDGMIALLGAGLNQIASMAMLKSDMYDAIKEHKANSNDTSEVSNLVLSGHSLGGHLAQSFAFLYTKDVKELYTFNAPGFGGAFASLVTISLRFVSFIAKAIMKGIRWIARLLDPNGFVGKIVGSVFNKIKNMLGFKDDKSTLKDCVNVVQNNEKACKELGDKNINSNINKSSKGSSEIEVHHCDSVRHKIYDKNDEGLFDASDDGDSLKREWNQLYEPSTSVISDLGFRYGLGAESLDGHLAEYDYKNTKKLHLINILVASHFMKQIVESLYLMEYLLSNEKNEAKIKDKDVPAALDYLNDYIQSLSFNVYFYKISLGYLPKLGSEDKKRLSILESVIYPVALYVNSLGFEDENEAPNLEDPVSSLLYYKEKDKFVDMIDREEIKALDAKDIASKVKSGDLNLFFAIYSVRYFMLSKKADLKAFKDRMSYISDFFKIASSHANSNSNEKELEQYINTRLEIYRSAYELKFESFKYADDNKHYVVIAKTNTDKKITRGIVLTHNFKLIDNVAKDAKNDVAKEYLNVIRLEPNELMHISEGKMDILLRDKSIFDINQVGSDLDIDFTKLKTQVYIIDKPLNTATEQSDYPLYFKKEEDGEESNSNLLSFTHQPRDEEKDKGRLTIDYKNQRACVLNYSLLNKSLNIDLKPTNKETKESLERANERLNLEKKSSAVSAGGTAFANPIIEDDVVVCPHGGHVILKSRAGKSIRSDDQGVILDVDFINSPIVGCSAKNPCTKVAYVPRAALSLKSMNNHYAVMQDLVPACLSNTSSPLRCIKKENRIKLAHSIGSPTSENNNAAVLNPNLNSAHIRLHVKSALNQADNLAVCIYKLNDVEHKNQEGFKEMELNLDEGGDVKDKKLKEHLSSRFRDDKFSISSFNFKYSLMDKNFIFITPKYIESIYKNTTLPKSGIGFFQFVDDISDESNLIYVTPSKAKTVDIKFACGLDSKYNDDINTTKTVVVA